ncbi:southpaw [Nothobranchius furzeri]|uniref:Nodal-like protein n=1 Tax=Nothobranchius furzeri TaxID=105023 RepID=A0A1A8B8M7_NOTFU|nr:southpaw [Nothobranchius furzeri]KAF7200289.1 nodal-like protein [Nothobranchius furzeri]
MEARVLMVFCTLVCCFGAVSSVWTHRYRSHLENDLVRGNLSTGHHGRYPLYMMQLYRSFRTADFSSSPGFSTITTQSEDPSVYTSDSVLSLMAKGCHQVGDRWTVTFDMSSISTSELVLLAELQIRLPAFSASKRATVDFYHSQKQSCGPGSASCQEAAVFLGSFRATPSSTKSSWKMFNVTALLKHWLDRAGVVLTQEASGEPETEEESGSGDEGNKSDELSLHLVTRQRKVKHPTTNQVMMVIFSKQDQLLEGRAAYSLIYTVKNSKYVTKNTARGDNQSRRRKRNRIEGIRVVDGAAPTVAPASADRSQRPLCRRVDMWVDFDHIGWDEWIVHPKRFNAYRCEGECPTPLDVSFNPTNHAYMQSLFQLHHPERGSCPSCVPTRLSPLSMLYHENDDLMLRHHEEMIVEECGCH